MTPCREALRLYQSLLPSITDGLLVRCLEIGATLRGLAIAVNVPGPSRMAGGLTCSHMVPCAFIIECGDPVGELACEHASELVDDIVAHQLLVRCRRPPSHRRRQRPRLGRGRRDEHDGADENPYVSPPHASWPRGLPHPLRRRCLSSLPRLPSGSGVPAWRMTPH